MIRKFSAVKPELCDIGFQHSRNLIFPQSIACLLYTSTGLFTGIGPLEPHTMYSLCWRKRPFWGRLVILSHTAQPRQILSLIHI